MIIELQTASLVKVWKQERLIVHDTTFNGWLFYTNLHGSAADPIATYATGELYCDLTDYIRTYPSVGTIYFAEADDPATYKSFAVQVVGLISPESVLIPYQPLVEGRALVIPPSRILLEHPTTSYVECEFYSTVQNVWSVTGRAALSVNERVIGQIDGDFKLDDGGGASKTYSPKLIRCGVEYALVRWVSFTGIARTHVFEVVKRKTSTDGAYSLMPIDSEYIDIKGRVDAFTLRLDGLDAYDMWYYSDMITSSKVEVSFDRANYDRVQVTSNSVLLPDGNAGTDGVLEINVNWKRYDAVAM
jgi:hypothetical protein